MNTKPARHLTLLKVAVTAAVLLALASPALGESEDPRERHLYGDVINIFTSDIVIPEGTVRHGSVICVGRDVRVEGELAGDLIVVMGSATIDGGRVRDSLIGVLSEIDLKDAEVRGDLFNILGGLSLDAISGIGRGTVDLGLVGGWFPGFVMLLTWLRVLGLLLVFVLLVLLVAIASDRVRLIGEETPSRYLSGLLLGLVIYVAMWTLVFPIALGTVIGLPVLLLAWTAVKWLGIAGLFYSLGSSIGRGFGRGMSPMGAVLLVFAINAGILLLLSLFGLAGLILIGLYRTVFFVFIEAPAVGLILLTRFGTRPSSTSPSSPMPPAELVTPPPPLDPGPPGSVIGSPGPVDPSGDRID